MKNFNIAIDGPSGVGKSTAAKNVAKRLGINYVDTGAMFRALALYVLDKGVNPEDEEKISNLIKDADLFVRYKDGVQYMILSSEDVTKKLKTNAVSSVASVISQYPLVRRKILELERNVAEKHNVVMDGRDIGTVVLPEASLKIFLTADIHERALRRYREIKETGRSSERTLKEVREELEERDLRDSKRKEAPLKKAIDAVVIDSTNLSAKDVENRIIDLLKKVTVSVNRKS